MANEQPDYTVIKKDNEFEIRQYTNFLTATVETEGERDDAIGKGFRILFKYISGENKNKESISMTVPVMQKSSGNNKWSVSFVVPKDIKMPVGNGRVSFYSRDEAFKQDFTGYESQIKVGAYNNKAVADNTPPKVKLYMNNDSFVSGGIVNTSPTLIAYVEDENGINTSGGIGHDIVAYLDGDETKPFILNMRLRKLP